MQNLEEQLRVVFVTRTDLRRSSLQTLLVDIGCGGALDLLPGDLHWYQGSLA